MLPLLLAFALAHQAERLHFTVTLEDGLDARWGDVARMNISSATIQFWGEIRHLFFLTPNCPLAAADRVLVIGAAKPGPSVQIRTQHGTEAITCAARYDIP